MAQQKNSTSSGNSTNFFQSVGKGIKKTIVASAGKSPYGNNVDHGVRPPRVVEASMGANGYGTNVDHQVVRHHA